MGKSLNNILKKQYRSLLRKQPTLPKVVGSLALRHFKRSMNREGFYGSSFQKWPQVNRRKPGHKQYNPKQQQKMLVGKASTGLVGTLRIKRAAWKQITISSFGKQYAIYHNQGSGKLPKRQFLGNSSKLEKDVGKLIKREIDKIFRV